MQISESVAAAGSIRRAAFRRMPQVDRADRESTGAHAGAATFCYHPALLSTPWSGVKINMGRIVVAALVGLLITGQAWSQDCSQTIEGNDQIQFNKKEIKVSKSCKEVTVTLKHVGMLAANVMGHNFVLAKTGDYQALAQAGQGAGPPNYLPPGDARVIATTGVIGGGQQASVKIDMSKLTAGGDYTFFCSFPGHFVLMNGKFIVE